MKGKEVTKPDVEVGEITAIATGADEAAFELTETLAGHLRDSGYEVKNFGFLSKDPIDRPEIAIEAAEAFAEGERAVIRCGPGIGVDGSRYLSAEMRA